MNHRSVAVSLLVLGAWLFPALAQGIPLTVSAGKDDTIQIPSLDLTYNMRGDVNDDASRQANLVTAWTQISGPVTGFVVKYPQFPGSLVSITAKGTYAFRLIASDGVYSVDDTVQYVILDSLPFLVLTPAAGQKVVMGDSFLVTWQFNQDEDVLIRLSTDDGFSYELIQENRWKGKSWTWHVPDTLLVSDRCPIKISKYRAASRSTVSAGFSLVKPSGISHPGGKSGRGARAVMDLSDPGCETFLLDGRRLDAADPRNDEGAGPAAHGLVVCRSAARGVAVPKIEIAR